MRAKRSCVGARLAREAKQREAAAARLHKPSACDTSRKLFAAWRLLLRFARRARSYGRARGALLQDGWVRRVSVDFLRIKDLFGFGPFKFYVSFRLFVLKI